MKQLDLPNYSEISHTLSHTTFKLHPSQAHGLICSLLSAHAQGAQLWAELVTGDKELGVDADALRQLYNASAQQLEDFLFEFQLLLPADTASLPERAEALTLWSQGFLTGLKLADVDLINRQPSQMTEAINDIIEIAKMNYEYVVASEEDEAAYVEIVEYVRMAVIYIYQELHERTMDKVASHRDRLH